MKNSFLNISAAGILSLALCFQARGQSVLPYVLASTGSAGTMPNGSTVNFTVGEPFTSTIGSSPQFTQGFQQPSTSGNPLPVQLLDFTGTVKTSYNLLQWHTAQEKNNNYFNVERSPDGNHFITIGKVYSKANEGNSSTELAYSYADKTMPGGVNYYRLQQTDLDKRSSYSKVIRLENAPALQSFSVSPNPAKEKVFLSVRSTTDHAQLLITDINGRELSTMNITQPLTEINIGAWVSGTYFFRYSDGQISESVKVVKE